MTNASAAPKRGTSPPLDEGQPPPRGIEELGWETPEPIREALEHTVARLRAAEEGSAGVPGDAGFSCEWWPPD